MNSVTRHLGPASIAATLFAMRSGKKEIFLVVEGDTDVDLLSEILSLSHSNFVSCRGKENLHEVFAMSPRKGIDEGTIFLRDRDHDNVVHSNVGGVHLYVTDLYDLEMHLLIGRIYARMFRGFKKGYVPDGEVASSFLLITNIAAWIGALRHYSSINKIGLKFDDIKHSKFLNARDFSFNLDEFIRYMFAKSEIRFINTDKVKHDVERSFAHYADKTMLICSKDMFEIMHIAISRHYKLCESSECEPAVLSRSLRVSALLDDLRGAPFFSLLSRHIEASQYLWTGCRL